MPKVKNAGSGSALLTRRAAVFGLIAAPGVISAAPLFDTSSGLGMFSPASLNSRGDAGSLLNLYSDPEPDLAPQTRLNQKRVPSFKNLRPLRIALQNANTNETMRLDLLSQSKLSDAQVSQLNHFLRDWRQNEIKAIDGAVLEDLLEICEVFAPRGSGALKLRITSGYRSKATNDMLRRKSANVARRSLHMQGRAIDFSFPDVPISKTSRTAKKLCSGGVGTYRTFLHIDSGPRRSWGA